MPPSSSNPRTNPLRPPTRNLGELRSYGEPRPALPFGPPRQACPDSHSYCTTLPSPLGPDRACLLTGFSASRPATCQAVPVHTHNGFVLEQNWSFLLLLTPCVKQDGADHPLCTAARDGNDLGATSCTLRSRHAKLRGPTQVACTAPCAACGPPEHCAQRSCKTPASPGLQNSHCGPA